MNAATPLPASGAGAHAHGGRDQGAGQGGGFRRLPEKEGGLEEPAGKKRGAGVKAPREMSCASLHNLAWSTSPPGPESLPVPTEIKAQMEGFQPRWSWSMAA